MGSTPARQFPMPGSYAMDNQNVVSPQDPTPVIPQQQFVSDNSYSGSGQAAAPTNPMQRFFHGQANGGFRKFFGDMDLGDNGMPIGRGRPANPVNPTAKKPNPTGPGQQFTQNGLY